MSSRISLEVWRWWLRNLSRIGVCNAFHYEMPCTLMQENICVQQLKIKYIKIMFSLPIIGRILCLAFFFSKYSIFLDFRTTPLSLLRLGFRTCPRQSCCSAGTSKGLCTLPVSCLLPLSLDIVWISFCWTGIVAQRKKKNHPCKHFQKI